MFRPDTYSVSPSFLSILDDKQEMLPLSLQLSITDLKTALRHALLSEDHYSFEPELEKLIPEIWKIRIEAIPVLAQMNLNEALQKSKQVFVEISQLHPLLSDAVQKLLYGLLIMSDFVAQTIDQNPDLLENLADEIVEQPPVVPSYEQIRIELTSSGETVNAWLLQLIHHSLLIELLLFAVDLVAEEDLPIESGMHQELSYHAAVAVEMYAACFQKKKEDMPWYSSPKNELQKILLQAPVATDDQIQFIQEKRAHFNAWQ